MKILTPDDLDSPRHRKSLAKLIGRKVWTGLGIGVLVRMRDGGCGVRVRWKCRHEGCKHRTTVYLCPGVHYGAYCIARDFDGNFLADLRNQCYDCGRHRRNHS